MTTAALFVLVATFALMFPDCASFGANSTDILTRKLDISKLRDAFAKVVIREKGSAINRWDHYVRIKLVSEKGVPPFLIQTLGNYVREVSEITKLDVSFVSNHPNFVMIFGDDLKQELEYQRSLLLFLFRSEEVVDTIIKQAYSDPSRCIQILKASPQNSISMYVGIVGTKNDRSAEKTENCLARNLLSGFGLKEATLTVPSVYDPSEDVRELSEYDKAILRILYDDRIKLYDDKATVQAKVNSMLLGQKN